MVGQRRLARRGLTRRCSRPPSAREIVVLLALSDAARRAVAERQSVRRFPFHACHKYAFASLHCMRYTTTDTSFTHSMFSCGVATEQARMKVKEVLKLLEDDGWLLVRTTGSHRQFKHPIKPGTLTVVGK